MPLSRRTFLATIGVAPLGVAETRQRPNVLFLIADDLNTDLACYGVTDVKTPNVDRLATEAVRFERAYCQYPLCNPSRSSFLSGLRPEKSGVLDQKSVLRKLKPEVLFLPDFFKRNGYFVAGAGKVFHQGKPNQAGFDVWEPAETTHEEEIGASTARYGKPEGDRTPNWAKLHGGEERTADAGVVRAVNGWMEQCAKEKRPFFLVAGLRKPHLPWAVPEIYFDQYKVVELRDDPPFSGIPKAALETELGPSRPPESRWQAVAAYRAATSYMDAQAGKILDALRTLQLRENTIVVMIGDNGFHLGEHKLWSKHTLFERATRVPMLIAAPGVTGGKVCRRTTELLDIYPTLAQLAGLPLPGHLEGMSLLPLLRKPGMAWERPARSVVLREDATRRIFGRAIRTERWRYVEWNEGQEGVELYDHSKDAGEYENLAQRPEHAETVKQLRAKLQG